jgi:hypothetical protein
MHRGEEAAALLRAFPSRAPATSWPATEEALQDVVERLQEPPLRADGASAQHQRLYGARVLLAWLESLPATPGSKGGTPAPPPPLTTAGSNTRWYGQLHKAGSLPARALTLACWL